MAPNVSVGVAEGVKTCATRFENKSLCLCVGTSETAEPPPESMW